MVWTCPQTPMLVHALASHGAPLRSLDLNAFLLDPVSAGVLAGVTGLNK